MRPFVLMTMKTFVALALLGAAIDRGLAQSSWTDKKERLRLTIPTGWKAELDGEGVLLFEGPSGAILSVFITPQTGAPAQASEEKRASVVRANPTLMYKFGPVTDVRVGNEPGKSLEFTTVPRSRPAAAPRSFSFSIVNHGNMQYDFTFSDARRATTDAILRSVVFLK